MGDDIRTANVLLNSFNDIDLAINTGKTKYVEVGCHPGVMTNENINTGTNTYEKLKTFKYLGSLLTNEDSINEEIKFRLKAGNSCYYSVHTLLDFQN